MAKNRLIGDYPVIGIRPTIDGRRGPLKVRESLEVQTMNMAKSAAKLFEENLKYSNGEPVKVVIADTTIGRVAEAAACADKFKKAGVDINERKAGFHSLRHSFSTMLLNEDVSLYSISKILGHQKIDTTLQYAMVKQSNVKNSHRRYIG